MRLILWPWTHLWNLPFIEPAVLWAVLAELRETFGYDHVSDRTAELLLIADYEHKVDRFVEMMTELMQTKE